MFLNPFSPLAFIKFTSLKATTFFLLILLIKSNLLRLKGGLIGGLYAYRVKNNDKEEEGNVQDLEPVNI